eukprot:snap_masked-scaffold_27-processed-gene-4.49-mRNA-1 protein AED:1.00 eAED:1.00 QI:0/-1/0/0/-1/1/1/0/62
MIISRHINNLNRSYAFRQITRNVTRESADTSKENNLQQQFQSIRMEKDFEEPIHSLRRSSRE